MIRFPSFFFGALLASLLTSNPSSGQTVSGQITPLPQPPASLQAGALEGSNAVLFLESSDIVLQSDLVVDYKGPGVYMGSSASPAVIPVGTCVQSYLIHLDGVSLSTVQIAGTITFPQRILGVIGEAGRLDASDGPTGAAGTSYAVPGAEPGRGVEAGIINQANDQFSVSTDRYTLDLVSLTAGLDVDQLRVILEPGARPLSAGLCGGVTVNSCDPVVSVIGVPSPTQGNGFIVTMDKAEGNQAAIVFFTQNGDQSKAWIGATGFQCLVPPFRRAGLKSLTGQNGSCNGLLTQDLNQRWCPTCPRPNHAPTPGLPLQYQIWYRQPSTSVGALSDAFEIMVCP